MSGLLSGWLDRGHSPIDSARQVEGQVSQMLARREPQNRG